MSTAGTREDTDMAGKESAMNAETSLVIAIIEEKTRSLSEDDSLVISRDYLARLSGLPLPVATRIAERLVKEGAIERHRLPNGGNRAYYSRKPQS